MALATTISATGKIGDGCRSLHSNCSNDASKPHDAAAARTNTLDAIHWQMAAMYNTDGLDHGPIPPPHIVDNIAREQLALCEHVISNHFNNLRFLQLAHAQVCCHFSQAKSTSRMTLNAMRGRPPPPSPGGPWSNNSHTTMDIQIWHGSEVCTEYPHGPQAKQDRQM